MSEYPGFVLVTRNTFGPKFFSDVTGCRKTQVSDCTSSTVIYYFIALEIWADKRGGLW